MPVPPPIKSDWVIEKLSKEQQAEALKRKLVAANLPTLGGQLLALGLQTTDNDVLSRHLVFDRLYDVVGNEDIWVLSLGMDGYVDGGIANIVKAAGAGYGATVLTSIVLFPLAPIAGAVTFLANWQTGKTIQNICGTNRTLVQALDHVAQTDKAAADAIANLCAARAAVLDKSYLSGMLKDFAGQAWRGFADGLAELAKTLGQTVGAAIKGVGQGLGLEGGILLGGIALFAGWWLFARNRPGGKPLSAIAANRGRRRSRKSQ